MPKSSNRVVQFGNIGQSTEYGKEIQVFFYHSNFTWNQFHPLICMSGRLYFFKALNSNFCKVAKNPQDGKFWVSEVVKSTLFFFFELLKSSKLISHKIQVVEKYLNLRNVLGVFTCSILASIVTILVGTVTILVGIVVILTSIKLILLKCAHLQV